MAMKLPTSLTFYYVTAEIKLAEKHIKQNAPNAILLQIISDLLHEFLNFRLVYHPKPLGPIISEL